MITFVVTGGIASGKSNVMSLLEKRGLPTLNADAVGHEVGNTPQARERITAAFGEGYYPEGKLDRAALGRLVFADSQKREQLNAIMHGLIYERIRRWIAEHSAEKAVAIEIPLLFESGKQQIADVILHCYAPRDTQMIRLMARNGLTETEALQRIDAQMPTEQKMALAHHNIDTSGSFLQTAQRVDEILKQYEV